MLERDATSDASKSPGRSIHRRLRLMAARTVRGSILARRSELMTLAVSRTSGSASATRVSSRLSTSMSPLASRMSPRGAGSFDAAKCWRRAFFDQSLPCTTCTFAACAISASANRTKAPWTTATRLGPFIASLTRQNHDLVVRWDMHAQPGLGDGAEALARRCIANLALDPRALALELGASVLELGQSPRFADSDRPSPDDREGDDQE